MIYVSSKRASQITGYAQDYIGQLARSGQVDAKRMGGLWYISMPSLEAYKTLPDSSKSVSRPDATPISAENEKDVYVSFDGRDYISANRVSKITGYNQDYVGQLARSGKVLSRQVGKRWYIDRDAILTHKKEKDDLLAAVQSEAVGIKTIRQDKNHESAEKVRENDISVFKYLKDEGDLLPLSGKESLSDYESPYQPAEGDIIDLRGQKAQDVPIHIIKLESEDSFEIEAESAAAPQRAILIAPKRKKRRSFPYKSLGVYSGFAIAIISILVFYVRSGPISFKGAAQDLSATCIDALEHLESGVESLISRDLVYKRQD